MLAEIFAEDSPTPEALMVSFPVIAEAGGMKEEKVPIIIISTTRRDLVVFDNMVSPHRRRCEPPLNTSITGRTAKYHS